MNIQSNLEINFHSPDEVSVFLENTAASDKEEKFGEILLFCSFTLRTMVNFGKHPVASWIAQVLSQVKGNLKDLMDQRGPDEPKINYDYLGPSAKKRFVADLKCADNNFNFQYNTKGFGFMAGGMGYYASNSVFVLMKYLAKMREDDKEYIEALENAAEQCGAIYSNGQLSIPNQSKIALVIANGSYSLDADLDDNLADNNGNNNWHMYDKLLPWARKKMMDNMDNNDNINDWEDKTKIMLDNFGSFLKNNNLKDKTIKTLDQLAVLAKDLANIITLDELAIVLANMVFNEICETSLQKYKVFLKDMGESEKIDGRQKKELLIVYMLAATRAVSAVFTNPKEANELLDKFHAEIYNIPLDSEDQKVAFNEFVSERYQTYYQILKSEEENKEIIMYWRFGKQFTSYFLNKDLEDVELMNPILIIGNYGLFSVSLIAWADFLKKVLSEFELKK